MKPSRDTMPDVFWYQLNGKSAQENYMEQKKAILERLTNANDEFNINLTSEVKVI